jgi:hypothetical protein
MLNSLVCISGFDLRGAPPRKGRDGIFACWRFGVQSCALWQLNLSYEVIKKEGRQFDFGRLHSQQWCLKSGTEGFPGTRHLLLAWIIFLIILCR